jgi:O-antigen/teichoic acid export membrane protein
LVLSLALYAEGWLTLSTALASYVVGLGVSLLFESYHFARMRMEPADRSSNRQHLAVAARTWPGDIFNALLLRGDVLIVGALLPIDVVAIYIVAQRLAIFVDFPLDAIRTSAGPALSRAFAQDPAGGFRRAAAEISGIYAGGGILGALGVAALGMPALMLFGAGYTDGYVILLVLVLGRLAPVILGPASIVMNLTDQEASFSIVNGLSAALLCALVAGGAMFGPVGAAVGVSVSTWMSAAVLAYLVHRRHGFPIGLVDSEARAVLAPANGLAALRSLRRPLKGEGIE